MKRLFLILLAVSTLLAGCSAQTEKTNTFNPESGEAAIQKVPQEDFILPHLRPVVQKPTASDETAPAPEVPESTPEQPAQPSTPTQTAQPTPSVSQPSNPPQTAQPAPSISQPSSSRPTSLSTSKDTGSSKIWDYDLYTGMDYCEETDPTRSGYLQKIQYVNPLFYYFEMDSMRMFLEKNYGMPLITSREQFQTVVWESSDPSVATVNEVGFVTPLKEGTTVICATLVDPETQSPLVRRCTVKVEKMPAYTYAELEEKAKIEAKRIADTVMSNANCTSDLARIAYAASLVHNYVKRSGSANFYQIVNGNIVSGQIPGYNQPYGTLVTSHSSCAGDTRALGMVLEYMGFEWYHVNANQWDHQWCVVYDVDGQTAFADASVLGIAGYGDRDGDHSNWMQYYNNKLYPYYG